MYREEKKFALTFLHINTNSLILSNIYAIPSCYLPYRRYGRYGVDATSYYLPYHKEHHVRRHILSTYLIIKGCWWDSVLSYATPWTFYLPYHWVFLMAVFRIRFILIRIRILGSVSDDYGSGSEVTLTLWILFSLLNVLQCFFI